MCATYLLLYTLSQLHIRYHGEEKVYNLNIKDSRSSQSEAIVTPPAIEQPPKAYLQTKTFTYDKQAGSQPGQLTNHPALQGSAIRRGKSHHITVAVRSQAGSPGSHSRPLLSARSRLMPTRVLKAPLSTTEYSVCIGSDMHSINVVNLMCTRPGLQNEAVSDLTTCLPC